MSFGEQVGLVAVNVMVNRMQVLLVALDSGSRLGGWRFDRPEIDLAQASGHGCHTADALENVAAFANEGSLLETSLLAADVWQLRVVLLRLVVDIARAGRGLHGAATLGVLLETALLGKLAFEVDEGLAVDRGVLRKEFVDVGCNE